MSDRDKKTIELDRSHVVEHEPEAGEGARSLANWSNLARARQSLAANTENVHAFEKDPSSYLQRFGLNIQHLGSADRESFALAGTAVQQFEVEPDAQLAFCKVWGITIVVAAAAIVVAAAVNVAAAANVGVVVNVAGAANAFALANVSIIVNASGFGDA